MERANVNGVDLAYELTGSGEPVLLISPVVADGFLPLLSAPALVGRFRLIRYHRRGWSGSGHAVPPVSVHDHATDAAALLEHLGISRAHVAGHSTGGVIALQLAFERPDLVHTLGLLEPLIFSVPSAGALVERAAPSIEAYRSGDRATAVAGFLSAVSGLEWHACRAVMDEHIPSAVAELITDADTLFDVELPAVGSWEFGREQAATIVQPVLSVLGTNTEPLWVEVAELLRSWFPQIEERIIDGVGHLLHMQRPAPVARSLADFLHRNAVVGSVAA